MPHFPETPPVKITIRERDRELWVEISSPVFLATMDETQARRVWEALAPYFDGREVADC